MLTNRWYAEHMPIFIEACVIANLAATKRQASKYRRGLGTAIKYKQHAVKSLKAKQSGSAAEEVSTYE